MFTDDPINLFQQWLSDAEKAESEDANAVALSTCFKDCKPSVRMVLLKNLDHRGFVFYSNLNSRKGEQLLNNAHAAMCFHWKSLKRQVRVEGVVDIVSDNEADEYFSSRPRMSQIGAWASKQSSPMGETAEFENRISKFTKKYERQKVPRPKFWSGFRIVPNMIEFWSDKKYRLHERILFNAEGDSWKVTRLYP